MLSGIIGINIKNFTLLGFCFTSFHNVERLMFWIDIINQEIRWGKINTAFELMLSLFVLT